MSLRAARADCFCAVVSTDATNESTQRTLTAFGEKIGKTVIQCKDTPGFVVNRLLVPLMAEAMRMVRSVRVRRCH